MASITVDVQAKVVGYEASIKALQAALAKVNPGSDIGKKISAALTQAQKQVQDLSRNMFPKASSDNQIDAIVEKVNRAGIAIQNVSNLMQGLTIGDLNFGTLSSDITSVINQISALESQIDNTFNQGIREAVGNSAQLKAIFQDLGVDIAGLTVEGGTAALSKGLADAGAAAAAAQANFEQASAEVDKLQASLANVKNANLFGGDFNLSSLLGDLGNFADPEKILSQQKLEELRNNICERIASLNLENGSALQDKVTALFGEIDPKTTLEQFKQKWFMIQTELEQFGLKGKQITSVLGTSGNGQKLFESLVGFDESNLEEVKSRLLNVLNTFRSIFTDNQWNKITELIDKGSIEKACREGAQAIETAYNTYEEKIRAGEEKVRAASDAKRLAENALNGATENFNRFNNANESYAKSIETLTQKVEAQQQEITALKEQLQGKVGAALNDIKGGVTGAGAVGLFPTKQADEYKGKLSEIHSAEQMVGRLQGVVQRWFSVYAVVRMVSNAVRSVINTTKELDKTITEIAIVTNMSQDQLWGQMDKYTEMARKYGASISGVYKVSQLYYQQGLGQEDVMALSEQTLKMARISGLDYAQATDYMTNAVRSFKLEMQDAQSVVDTYSAVAATSATSVTELATAMSKTASSAEAVGASLQNTTAMMAVMIEATRESPENIGSAMKSIISRYGELKENKTGIDAEGEEYSLNKVDKALQTVGISIHDAKGEFRDFDDVIMELADNWDTIDKNTQRYIATVMAGNRQQSRFLALVSSGKRLRELSDTAANSEDASQAQFLKTMDSVEFKSQQLQTSIQSLWTDTGVQDVVKGFLDNVNQIIQSFANISNAFNSPIAAVMKFGVQFANIARIVTTTFGLIKSTVATQIDAIRNNSLAKAKQAADQETQIIKNKYTQEEQAAMHTALVKEAMMTQGMGAEEAQAYAAGRMAPILGTGGTKTSVGQRFKGWAKTSGLATGSYVASILGALFSTKAMSMGEDTQKERDDKANLTLASSLLTGVGMGGMFGLPGLAVGGLIGLVSGLIQSNAIREEDPKERAARLEKELDTAKNENIAKKNEYKQLKDTIDEYEQLKDAHLESEEALEKYIEKSNELAENHPDLVQGYDAEGNAIINLVEAYNKLKAAKEGVTQAEKAEADKQIENAENNRKEIEKKLAEAQAAETAAQLAEENGASFEEYSTDLVNSLQNALFNTGRSIRDIVGPNDNEGHAALTSLYGVLGEGDLSKISGVITSYADWFSQNTELLQNLGLDNFASFVEATVNNLDTIAETEANGVSEVDRLTAQRTRAMEVERAERRAGAKSTTASKIDELLLQDKINGGFGEYDYLTNIKNASTIISNVIAKRAQDYGAGYYTDQVDADFIEINDALKSYVSIFPDMAEKLDETIALQGDLTESEMIEQVTQTLKIGSDSPLYDAFLDYYNHLFVTPESLNEVFEEQAGQQGNQAAFLAAIFQGSSSFYDNLGQNELQSLLLFYNSLREKLKNNTISENIASEVAETYLTLWEHAVNYASSDREKSNQVQKLLSETNFSSNEDVEAFVDGLQEIGVTFEDLNLNANEMNKIRFPENFSGRIQAFAQTTSEQLTKFDKELSSATKGMNFSEAAKLADNLKISINDFKQVGNKFYLEDIKALEDYYFKDREKAISTLSKAQTKELDALKGFRDSNGASIDDQIKRLEHDFGESWGEHLEDLFSDSAFVKSLSNAHIDPKVLKNQITNYAEKGQDWGSFLDYLENNFDEQYQAIVTASNEALTYSIASSYLSAGKIESFLERVGVESNADLINQIASGDTSELPEALQKYAKLISDTFSAVKSNVVSAALDALENGSGNIFVTATNKQLLTGMQEKGWITGNVEENQEVQFAIDKILADEETFKTWIGENINSRKQIFEWFEKYNDIKYPNLEESIINLAGTEKTVSSEDIRKHLNSFNKLGDIATYAKDYGLKFNKFTNSWDIEDYDKYIEGLKKDAATLDTQSDELVAAIDSATRQAKFRKTSEQIEAFDDIIKNYSDVTDSQITALEIAVGKDWEQLKAFFSETGRGTYKLNIRNLRNHLDSLDLEENVANFVNDMFAEVVDDYLKNITTATSLLSSGTNSQADIQKFIDSAKDLGLTIGKEAFSYDTIAKSWTLDPKVLLQYVNLQAQELVNAGRLAEEEVNAYLEANVKQNLANAIDVSSFLSSETKEGVARDKLKKQLTDFLSVTTEFGDIADQTAESYIKALAEGGKNAVKVMEAIMHAQGKEVSASNVESAYRSEISQLENAFDQLAYGPGSLITGRAKKIISTLEGYSITPLDDNNAVITQIGDISLAYKAYYDELAKNGERTLMALNAAKAKVLETQNGRANEQQAIDALGQASGMTYSAFAEILSNAGIELTDEIVNRYTESMGGNKMRIKDFGAFAAAMGWQTGSEEYTSAFKAYNDGLIELNRKAEKTIIQEVQGLSTAKGGDWINLTQLTSKLGDGATRILNSVLTQYGGYISGGILKLSSFANVLNIAQEVRTAAEAAGADLTAEVAELADVISSIIKSYGDAINKGITGGLTKAESVDLTNLASSLGVNNITFDTTVEGLKLSEQSAIALYHRLTQIDSVQAKLTLDTLNTSLQESNENYQSVSSILAHIENLSTKINAADSQASSARLKQYEAELSVATQILAIRSTQEDASFNFMSNKIPGAQNNPINYYNNWAKAIHTFNDAVKNKERGQYVRGGKTYESGFVDYEFWYNLVTEMNNIAAKGGEIEFAGEKLDGSLEAASRLIQKGADSLVATSTGDIKVALSGMSLDFEAGADAFSGNVTEGIQTFAKSQVEMLDGMIQMLETIVAMEKLGDIDGNGNKHIEIDDLFPKIDFNNGTQKIKDLAGLDDFVKAAGESLNNITVNGESLAKMISRAREIGLNETEAKNFTAVIDSLYQMYTSGEYNLDDLYGSIQRVMGTSGFEGTIELGDNKVYIKKGATIVETTDEEGKTIYRDSAGNTYSDMDEALARSTLAPYNLDKDKKIDYSEKTHRATGEITFTLDTGKINVEVSGDAEGNVTFNDTKGNTGSTWSEFVDNLLTSLGVNDEKEKQQKSVEVGLQLGEIKLDSVSYQAINSDLRQQLEDAFARGDVVEVDKIVNTNTVFQSVRGKSAQEIAQALGLDINLGDIITQGITNAIPNLTSALNQIDSSSLEDAASALSNMLSSLQGLEGIGYDKIAEGLAQLKVDKDSQSKKPSGGSASFTPFDFSGLFAGINVSPIESIANALSGIRFDPSGLEAAANAINNVRQDGASSARNAINSINAGPAQAARNALNGISIAGKTVQAVANIVVQVTHGSGATSAKGNVALAGGTPTLMGELGPELVVSNGRYFIVGQGGAEFVNLEKDAIVFNHKQTERLMSQGSIGSRGKPFTNETNAISYAKGNAAMAPGNSEDQPVWKRDWGYTYNIRTSDGGVSGHLWGAPVAEITLPSAAKGNMGGGPAKASASAALAALKQLRAQWQALAGLSAKDLAGKGGGGGGGGGGNAAFIKDLERWYNLLQEIAKLEQKITYEQTLRKKIASDLNPNGEAYAKSQGRNLEYLRKEVAAAQQLSLEQEDYFNQRRKELNDQNGPFSSLYEFDEMGQLKYKPGAFALLSERFGGDNATGQPNYSVREQYDWLLANGYGEYMKYNESGEEIKVEGKTDEKNMKAAIEAFWAKIETDRSEMQELHDSVEEQKKAVLEKMQEQNELLKEVEDNQISVENKVLKAIESAAKRQIDELKDQRDAFEKSNTALIDGLTNALDQERKMYDTQQSEDELETKRRRLEILRRSGGSASEINSLQAEIDSSTKDLYFDKQQEQIDTIQKASDAQLERLDAQIDLMTESLEYQKEHGMLWQQVYEVMAGSPEQIATFIQQNNSDYWGKSPTDLTKSIREDLFEAEQYVAYRDTVTSELKTMANLLTNQGLDSEWDNFGKMMSESKEYKDAWNRLSDDQRNNLKAIYAEELRNSGDPNAAARKVWESQLAIDYGITKKKEEPTAAVTPGAVTTPATTGGGGNGGKSKKGENGGTLKDFYESQNEYTHWHEIRECFNDGTQNTVSGTVEAHTFKNNVCTKCNYKKEAGWTQAGADQALKELEQSTETRFKYKWNGKEYDTADAAKSARTNYINTLQSQLSSTQIPESVKSEIRKILNSNAVKYIESIAYKNGGMNYTTGPAILHGTKSKPEAVINAEQTKILRENILGHSPNSLVNLLKDYNAAYKGLSSNTYDSISNNSYGGVIEHAEVNVHVDKLANGYDAAQAGDDIMREMLNIARKTGAQNRVGR